MKEMANTKNERERADITESTWITFSKSPEENGWYEMVTEESVPVKDPDTGKGMIGEDGEVIREIEYFYAVGLYRNGEWVDRPPRTIRWRPEPDGRPRMPDMDRTPISDKSGVMSLAETLLVQMREDFQRAVQVMFEARKAEICRSANCGYWTVRHELLGDLTAALTMHAVNQTEIIDTLTRRTLINLGVDADDADEALEAFEEIIWADRKESWTDSKLWNSLRSMLKEYGGKVS